MMSSGRVWIRATIASDNTLISALIALELHIVKTKRCFLVQMVRFITDQRVPRPLRSKRILYLETARVFIRNLASIKITLERNSNQYLSQHLFIIPDMTVIRLDVHQRTVSKKSMWVSEKACWPMRYMCRTVTQHVHVHMHEDISHYHERRSGCRPITAQTMILEENSCQRCGLNCGRRRVIGRESRRIRIENATNHNEMYIIVIEGLAALRVWTRSIRSGHTQFAKEGFKEIIWMTNAGHISRNSTWFIDKHVRGHFLGRHIKWRYLPCTDSSSDCVFP